MFYISPFIPLLQGGHFLFGFIAIPISFAALTVLGGIKVTTWRICRFPTGASAEQRYARAVTVRALTFALTHLTSARTAGVRCAMKCLVRPFTKGEQGMGARIGGHVLGGLFAASARAHARDIKIKFLIIIKTLIDTAHILRYN